MLYTTVSRIRAESGFEGNVNITDDDISPYLTQANGVLISYVASRYDITYLTTSTDFTDSQAENMLKRCEELLASGYLMIKEYGPEGQDSDKDGYKKVEEAMTLLQMIMEGKIKLINNSGSEFPLGFSKQKPAGFKSAGAVSGENIFSVKDSY